MRSTLVIGLALLLFYSFPKAQAQAEPSVRFGLRAGINFSNLKFTNGPETGTGGSWKEGLSLGGLMVVPVSKRFYLQQEYLYSEIGGEVEGTDRTYVFQYFSLPLFLRWELSRKLAFMAGPQFGLLINAKEDSAKIPSDQIHMEERSLGLTLGAEYGLFKSFGITARYMLGLNNVDLGQFSDLQEFKYGVFHFSIVYYFPK